MRGFLSSILLTHQILELVGCQITPTQLVLADPGNGCVPVGKLLLIGSELNLWVLLEDAIAVVAVHEHTIPDNERVDNNSIRQDVFLELFQLFLPKRRNLVRKLRVNG